MGTLFFIFVFFFSCEVGYVVLRCQVFHECTYTCPCRLRDYKEEGILEKRWFGVATGANYGVASSSSRFNSINPETCITRIRGPSKTTVSIPRHLGSLSQCWSGL